MTQDDVSRTVDTIIRRVRRDGDGALCAYAKRFDGVTLTSAKLRVPPSRLQAALRAVRPDVREALRVCAASIERFAQAERSRLTQSWRVRRGSVVLGQDVKPVDSVGAYIPGGRFPYPSTVLMTLIPARVAGVKRRIMATPPKNLTVEVLAAAAIAGVDELYQVGGAAAIAAMAYGTRRIAAVDFIVGPGNAFVTEAKRQVFGRVGIDSLAGPSEVVIIADRDVSVEYLVQDLAAQAEHDPSSRAILISTQSALWKAVQAQLPASIRSRVQFRRVTSWSQAADVTNEISPEHLQVMVTQPNALLKQIRHAGAIFVGPATSAVIGDYAAGPSHVLPTSGSARYASGLSVATFLKRSSVIAFSGTPAERGLWSAARTMAGVEGMPYHEAAAEARLRS